MKKTVALIISLCVVFSFFITAFAANDNIRVEELNLTVSIPDIYDVVTRSTDADDPVFDSLEMTKAEIMSEFEKNKIYLNAFSIYSNEEIVTTMDQISINNLNSFSDSYLNNFVSLFMDEYEDYGISILDYEIYQHKQTKFIKMHFYYGLQSAYGMQYYTVYDNQAINFTLRSYDGDISSAQELRIRSVVDSITFDTTTPSEDETEEFEYTEPSEEYTEPFIYTDDKTGVEFTVPSDWCEKPLSQVRKYIDVKFASTKQHDMIIMFGSTDLWSELPSSYKSGLSRSDFDNSCLSMSDISEMLGIDPAENCKKTYNGVDYYQIEFSTSVDLFGIEIPVTITEMVRIQNGWMYIFQFSGTEDSEYFSDFESLMNSVTYKSTDSAQATGATAASSSKTDALAWLLLILLIIAVIVIATLIIAPNIVYVQKRKGLFFDSPPSQPAEAMTKRIYKCGNCGRVGPYDGNCPVCGSSFKVFFDVPASANTTVQTAMPVVQTTPVAQPTVTAQNTPVAQPTPDVNYNPVNAAVTLAQPTDTAGDTRPDKPMFCRRCGAKLKPDSNFCCKCGTKTKEE